jgi:spermidine/putrescine transport system substrate-binding protein
MHPKEGWQADGRPPIPGVSRRNFLRHGASAGVLLGSGGLGALLAACGSSQSSTPINAAKALPRPDNPVTWPLYAANKPIKSGLLPEKNATLKIFNWVAYVNPQSLKDFGKKYNCKVEVTTFNNMTEALSKLGSGQVNFDVFMGVTADVLGKIIGQQLVQPLNHSYIPNISQAWHEFTSPFYDQHWQYTVPYTIYTTGIAWRKDHVSGEPGTGTWVNGYQFPWQPKYSGKVAILDDYRESISLGLLRNGITDLNTTDPAQIAKSQQSLQLLSKQTNMHIDNNDYTEVPSGQIWIHHAWSGDIAAAASYMPKGVPVDVVGYWFPKDGRGPIPQLHARSAECADQHQLQRLHAAGRRCHARAARARGNSAEEPDLNGRAAELLQARPVGAAATRYDGPGLAAGMASGQPWSVSGSGDDVFHARARRRIGRAG